MKNEEERKFQNEQSWRIAFGKKLKQVREEKGLTQQQLSFEIGIHQKNISDLEKGEGNPTLTTIIALALTLDISASELLSFPIKAE